MTITRQMLDTTYVCWFRNKRNTEKAKQEILKRFSEEPDDIHHWTEQDIYEQSRKIICSSMTFNIDLVRIMLKSKEFI